MRPEPEPTDGRPRPSPYPEGERAKRRRMKRRQLLSLLVGVVVFFVYKLTCGFLDVMFLYPAGNNIHDMVAGAVCFLVCLGILYRAEAHGRFLCRLWLPLAASPLLSLYEEWASLAASPPSTLEDAALLLLIPLLRYGFSGLWVMSLASLVADGILTFAAARRCANDSSRHA